MPDPLWEKYYGWTPWQYSFNNPLGFKDDNGNAAIAIPAVPIVILGIGTGAVLAHTYKLQTDPAYKAHCIQTSKSAWDAAVEGVNNVWNAIAGETKELKAPLKNQGEAGVPPPPDLDDGDKPSKSSQKDRTKGLQKKIEEHQQKLKDYMKDPLKHDDGRLKKAIEEGNVDRANNIINGRIESLQKQIKNFEKLYQNSK